MSGDSDSRKLTLQDLWEPRGESSEAGKSTGDEFTIKWARTLLAQITVIASLLGKRLPRPTVNEGPSITWELPEAVVTVIPEKKAASGTTDGNPACPGDHDAFVITGSICSPPEASQRGHKEYLSFSLSGKTSREFLFASAVNWFPLQNSFPLPPSRTVRSRPDGETIVETTPSGRKAIWIRPEERIDLHEVVRWNLTRLREEGVSVDGVRMTPGQMKLLKDGWDGADASPPSTEAVELADSISLNLFTAALSLGGEFDSSTYVFLDKPGACNQRDTIIQVSVDTGTTFVQLDIQCDSDQNRFSFLLDYDPTDTSPKKWYLKGECTILREPGKSSFQMLNEILRA